MDKYGYSEDEVKVVLANAVYALSPDADVPVDAKLRLMDVRQKKALREQKQELEKREAEAKRQQEESSKKQAMETFEYLGRSIDPEKYQASAAIYDDPRDYANAMADVAAKLVEAAEERNMDLPVGQMFIDIVQKAVEEQANARLERVKQRIVPKTAESEPKAAPKVPGALTSATPAPLTKNKWLTAEEANRLSDEILARGRG